MALRDQANAIFLQAIRAGPRFGPLSHVVARAEGKRPMKPRATKKKRGR